MNQHEGKAILETKDDFYVAFDLISKWIESLLTYPGFKDWKNASIVSTLTYGDPFPIRHDDHPTRFPFPDHITKQHDAVTSLMNLNTTWKSCRDTEYYFRRFPFNDLPISLEDHLRYTCEAYFGRIYEFSERLKRCLNSLNEVIPQRLDAGFLIKQFAKDFRQELKERNLIHHHAAFDEVMIDRIAFEGLMAIDLQGRGDLGWKDEQRRSYRKATREWAERAKKRSVRMRDYLNAAARAFVTHGEFLKHPVIR